MRILFDIGHPSHVHFFRNGIAELEGEGHETFIAVRSKEINEELLVRYGLDFQVYGKSGTGIVKKAGGLVSKDLQLRRIIKENKIDITTATGTGSPYIAHAGILTSTPSVNFSDTEKATLINLLTMPFSSYFVVPDCFKRKVYSRRKIRYPGYHELSYLHPNHYTPDRSVLDEFGEPPIMVRFSSLLSSHDMTRKGFASNDERFEMVKKLSEHGPVVLTTELDLPEQFDEYLYKGPKEKILDLLALSKLYVGEGATVASEAGVLGVPWIWISGGEYRGYLDDQEERFSLGYTIDMPKAALARALELLSDQEALKGWTAKRERLLEQKIDVAAFMVDLLGNFPESARSMKRDGVDKEKYR